MRLQKQLNIDNTYRVLNLNFYHPDHKKLIKVTSDKQEKIINLLHSDKKDEYTFIIDQDVSKDIQLNKLVYASKSHIIYYSRGIIPTMTFLDIGTNRHALFMYELQDFDKAILDNINTAAIVGAVAIYVPHIKPDTDPYSIIFKVNDVRFIADRLYLEFDNDVTTEEKEAFFDALHEVLARWTIQLYLKYKDNKEKEELKSNIINTYN